MEYPNLKFKSDEFAVYAYLSWALENDVRLPLDLLARLQRLGWIIEDASPYEAADAQLEIFDPDFTEPYDDGGPDDLLIFNH